MNSTGIPLLDLLIEHFKRLPGVGTKTALRYALFLLKQEDNYLIQFSELLANLTKTRLRCDECNAITQVSPCSICSDPNRDHTQICVVEDLPDLLSIERTGIFRGLYHVLGGLLNPSGGVAPEHLLINKLVTRIQKRAIKEIILALPSSYEGELTSYYLAKTLKSMPVKVYTLARGIPMGSHLEFVDEVTLAQSFSNKLPYLLEDASNSERV